LTIAPPGYYPAQGDPAGTVRYWDGEQWSAEPMPPPPGYDPHQSATGERYAKVWIRFGANLLDGLISFVISLPFLIPVFVDIARDIDAGGDGSNIETPAILYLAAAAVFVVSVVAMVLWGATLGKLIVGLRITDQDAATTPIRLNKALIRSTPQLLGLVPFVGPVISFGFLIASVVMVNTDPERRSAWDRLAGTRVVYKRFL